MIRNPVAGEKGVACGCGKSALFPGSDFFGDLFVKIKWPDDSPGSG
jgi:hypothetical protein